MLLIADSGATKADWLLLDKQSTAPPLPFATEGLSPTLLSTSEMIIILKKSALPQWTTQVQAVHFFGAGCADATKCAVVAKALTAVFPRATVSVKSDIWAAVLATCGNTPGFVSILGTGANACFFNGKTIKQKIPAIGYLLGDEGSGAYLGKQLLKNFLYHKLPSELHNELVHVHQLNKAVIIDHLHRQPHPNRYLASFTHFLKKHEQHPYIYELLRQSFHDFVTTHLTIYPAANTYSAHFIGSIAFHFKEILKQVLLQENITIGKIIQKPIGHLEAYFLSKK